MVTRKQLRKAIDAAKRETKQYHIYKLIGITMDGYRVDGAECCAYQLKRGNLLCLVNGNWRFERKPRSAGWVKGRTTVHYIKPMPRK